MNNKAIDLFAGMGGVTSALTRAGYQVTSVEKDPDNPGYSRLLHQSHLRNFPDHESRLQSVQEFAHSDLSQYKGVRLVHGSPSCKSYSIAHRGQSNRPSESKEDIDAAIAFNQVIAGVETDYFTLEQVPEYTESRAYFYALQGLQADYQIVPEIINLKRYGIPQSRRRLFVMGAKKGLKLLTLPTARPNQGWHSTITGLTCKPYKLPRQCEHWVIREPILLRPQKMPTFENSILQDQPYPTILRSHFVDQCCNPRSTSFKYVEDGKCWIIPLRAIARAQGFDDSFILPSLPAIAGSGIGNAFCPQFYLDFLKANDLANSIN